MVWYAKWKSKNSHCRCFYTKYTFCVYVYIYDLVPKGAHARGYALQLKIKHCWKLFLFQMLCCVLAWMNEYIVQIILATRLWLISRYSHHIQKSAKKWPPKTDIHVPSDFRHFAYKRIASTWSSNHWFVCGLQFVPNMSTQHLRTWSPTSSFVRGKHHFIWII